MIKRRAFVAAIATGAAILWGAADARSQPYPRQPIRMINPYAPGGAVEAMSRIFAQKLAGSDWPQVVVDNRPGASGTIAALATKQAKSDGYTLMIADTVSHALAIGLVSSLAYHPVKDFTPITLLWTFATVLAVPTSSPAKTVRDLVELAKQKPGGLDYASQGTGSAGHVLGAMLQKVSGVPMNHVPYKGAGPAMPDLLAGRVDFMFSTVGTIQPFVDAGKLRILANSSKASMRDIPSVSELGYPDVHYEAWFGLVGPAGMDAQIVGAIHKRSVAALAFDDFRRALDKAGMVPRTTTPEEMRALIQDDIERLVPIVRDALTTKK